jgi:hypothetical protein
MGRDHAEGVMARRLVADHRVERVDRLEHQDAGQAGDQVPEDRRHHAVAEILEQALHRRARHAMRVERVGIAADDVRDLAPAAVDALAGERLRDRGDVVVERALRHQHRDQQRLGGPTHAQPHEGLVREPADREHHTDHDRHGERAAQPAIGLAALRAVEAPVEERHEIADRDHGMRQVLEYRPRLADEDVEHEGEQQHRRRVRDPMGRAEPHGAAIRHAAGFAVNSWRETTT